MKAFRLTPERLDDRVNVGRKLAHFADEPLERSCGGWTEDPDEPPWCAWRTAGEKRQARAHDPEARQQPANPRQMSPRPQHAGALLRHGQPFSRRIDQHGPATRSGRRAAYARTTKLPNEWPTSTQRSSPARCASTAASSSTMRSKVLGHEGASLQASPARSYAQTRVNVAIAAGCTIVQLREEAAMPDSRSTIGLPCPRHTVCRRCPPTSIRDAGRSEPPSTSSGGNCLIECPGACERNQNSEETTS